MRALAASIAVHAIGLAVAVWLAGSAHTPAVVLLQPPDESATEVEIIEPTTADVRPDHGSAGGRESAAGHVASAHHARAHLGQTTRVDPWGGLALGMEKGNGSGNGNGNGSGNGIGFGDGGGIARAGAVPAAPVPPPPSKARPAKLLQPSRDLEVEDNDYLFVARVTVDEEGDVVAVRWTATHPGLRGDQASSAIWSFRYAPALDDAGLPIRSTFEQPFQVR